MSPRLVWVLLTLTIYLFCHVCCKSDVVNVKDHSNLRFESHSISSDSDGVGIPPGKRIIYVPWWPSFLLQLINNFYHQRPTGRSQFGVLYMGNINNLNAFPTTFNPHNADGSPVINNHNALSPANSSSYGNYITSRPENVQHTMVHAEELMLNEMNNLWNAYYSQYHQRPNFISLYSWIMPCPTCTNMIVNHFNQPPYNNIEYRVVSYTVEGTNSLPYMTPDGNRHSRQLMTNNSLVVYRQRCNRPNENEGLDFPVSEPNDVYDVELTPSADVSIDPDTHTCKLSDTFQGCLVYCLDKDLCCSCKKSDKRSMNVAMINDLTKKCATSDILKCSTEWVNSWISAPNSGASSCTLQDKVEKEFARCTNQCIGRPLSKPLSPHRPFYYPGYLTKFSDLSKYPEPQFNDYCLDMRTGSHLCTAYSSDSFTAGNTLCRFGNRCGTHGKKYNWCYVDFSNHWDYCCTGSCGFGKQTSYEWCTSGNQWQYCGKAGDRDIQNRRCLAEYPCGMHQENGKAGYYWCYVDAMKNWDRCCQPEDSCSTKGYLYNWCYTGYKKDTTSKTCTKP